TF
ncbi:Hypothetical protein EIN_234430, partial [Entamoeba invadens IP1]